MRKPTEPKVMRDIRAALAPALEGVEGVQWFRMGTKEGDRPFVEFGLERKQRRSVERYWTSLMKWMSRKDVK